VEFLAEALQLTSSALKSQIIEILLAEVSDELRQDAPEVLEWIEGVLRRSYRRQLKAA